ncbi:MAG: MFS transporter [candidate division Zixibacteria bacterium]|nr:MFS transporter [candidate division Zixibacteria bacterium]
MSDYNGVEQARHDRHGRFSLLSPLVWEGGYANLFVVLTGGAFLTGMALFFGAGDFVIGLLTAAPFLMQSAQLLAPFAFRSQSHSKGRIALVLAVSRQLWLLAIPLLFIDSPWRIHLLLGIVVLSSLLTMIATPAWLSWMADVIPQRVRGRFFSRRNAALAATTMGGSILGSLILDYFRASHRDENGYLTLLLLACLGGLLAWRAMLRMPDKHRVVTGSGFRAASLILPLKDRPFRKVLTAFFLWNGAIGLSAAFFAPHMLINLKMSFFQIGLYSTGAALSGIVASRVWGKLIDRFGSRTVLTICTFGIAGIPLYWLFPTAERLWILIPEVLYSGIVWGGFNLAAFTLPLDRSPREQRTAYLSVFAAITGFGFFLMSVFGGYLAGLIGKTTLTVGSLTLINYHFLFIGSALLRFGTAFFLSVLREPQDVRLPVVLNLMGYAVLKRMSLGRQILPVPVGRRSKDEIGNNSTE